ncbi:MAG: purine-binding chemotaxis protein CheW [Desulfobacter sp.]|jgi:purine-binding chemotaxis protein CheW|uniref:chemotaxis protein CheW n=1 Tax=Desulfobacter sp. TaxID=2294 RepID=UPI001B62D09D|nr:chemotaxis protein CheW [Desulfobacter sp.]MBP8829649.1 purine-binding chemotaxis protein CheW [Desulfobacter sp.]MDQ1271036.1 purine-binding chemotaxis protein CheW [Thermodesulfobacteriota bacterium]
MSVQGITQTSQYLTFKLDNEIYAMDITTVREVLDITQITKVPQMPDFMCGVINLRGSVVPVVDLRLKFGLEKAASVREACIVIIEIILDDEETVLGILVDSVQEVISLEPEQIDPPPRIGTRLKTQFIKGMGKKDKEFIIILETAKVFSAEELAVVQTTDDIPMPETPGGTTAENENDD